MAVTSRQWLNNKAGFTGGVELISGTFAFSYRGRQINSPYNLLVAHRDRDPNLQVLVHREKQWTDIRTAMQRENAVAAAIGTFRDGDFRPLGDVVINGVPERTFCPYL